MYAILSHYNPETHQETRLGVVEAKTLNEALLEFMTHFPTAKMLGDVESVTGSDWKRLIEQHGERGIFHLHITIYSGFEFKNFLAVYINRKTMPPEYRYGTLLGESL